MQFHIILDSPGVPENIGFICRNMKTTGMSQLHLISPCKSWKKKGWNTAFQSQEFLENAILHDSLEEAIKHVDFVIGTSAKKRITRRDPVCLDDVSQLLLNKISDDTVIGLVFGSEESGLSNEQLKLCDWVSYIPITTSYPSLNLSHAVMLYTYECSKVIRNPIAPIPEYKTSNENMVSSLKSKSDEVLKWLEIDQHEVLYQRIKDRIALSQPTDQKLFLSMYRFLKRKM